MGLTAYRRKRDFAQTPEPGGRAAGRHKPGNKAGEHQSAPERADGWHPAIFVVQKHSATRLHYDFRLEHGGVLKSWAVPKGPSLDPKDRRLAVEVEDHPLEYAKFEGVIPPKQYGAGPVIIWDRGTWAMQDAAADVDAALKKGTLKFVLHGERLRGGFTLVRMPDREEGKHQWLLIKERDEFALAGDAGYAERAATSVASGLTIEEMRADPGARRWPSNRAAAGGGPKPGPARADRPGATDPPLLRRTGALSSDVSRVWLALAGARRGRMPADPRPQLAMGVAKVPLGAEWAHEIKFDGYRVLARVSRGRAAMLSRNGKDWTHRFSEIARAVEALGQPELLLDGEVVALDEDGVSAFTRLQAALSAERTAGLIYMVFDVLHAGGVDVTGCTLRERRAVLADVLGARPPREVRLSEQLDGSKDLAQVACELGLEGIVSKRLDRPYVAARNGDWTKVRCTNRQEFVVGGLTRPQGARSGFGALAVGYHDAEGRLKYAGKVGTGYSEEQLAAVERAALGHAAAVSPFADLTRGPEARGVRWVEPRMVVEVEFLGWTGDGRLRHPVFRGVREDKAAADVVLERPGAGADEERDEPVGRASQPAADEPKATTARRTTAPKREAASAAPARRGPRAAGQDPVHAGVAITHAERVVYPEAGVTKGEVAAYYGAIAEHLLEHGRERPLSLVRCPRGAGASCFYNKHLEIAGQAGLRGVMIEESDGPAEYAVLTGPAGLIYLAQMNTLEVHAWGSRADRVEQPDRLVFDLDPGEGVEWATLCAAARSLRDLLGTLGLVSFVKTTGGKGLHVVVPIRRGPGWEEAKSFCRGVGAVLAARSPGQYLLKMSKAERRGKIFVDYLRNDRGATSVLAYSTRNRPGATVAMPVAWDEIEDTDPGAFTVRTAVSHVERRGRDPWREMASVKQAVTSALASAVEDALRAFGGTEPVHATAKRPGASAAGEVKAERRGRSGAQRPRAGRSRSGRAG